MIYDIEILVHTPYYDTLYIVCKTNIHHVYRNIYLILYIRMYVYSLFPIAVRSRTALLI